MLDQNAAQLVMLNAKNRVHKAIRTATRLQTTPIPLTSTPSTAAATAAAATAAATPRQHRSGRYQAYAAIDGDDPNEDWPPDEDPDDYLDPDNYPDERDYNDVGLVEAEQTAAPAYQAAAE